MPCNFASWYDYYVARDPGFRVVVTNPFVWHLLAKATEWGKTFIEWGCGTGYGAIELANRGKAVTGYDPDPRLVERARAAADKHLVSRRGRAVFTDQIAELPEAVDLVYSQGLLEHFDDAAIVAMLRQQRARARTAVFFSVPSENYPQKDFGDERLMPLAAWEAILAPAFGDKLTQLFYYANREHLLGVIKP